MKQRVRILILNIIVTVVLALLASQLGLFAFCQYNQYTLFCNSDYAYPMVGSIAMGAVLALLFIQQFATTQSMLQPKQGRPLPHVLARYNVFERTATTIWNVWNPDDKLTKSIPLDDMEDYGWVVEYTNGYPVIISQREFYYWLLDVAKRQQQLEAMGKKSTVSPLGGRSNPGLSRKRLEAYMTLLESIDAVEYVNANVRRLKPMYAADVWMKIIKPLEAIKPMVKI